MSVITPVYNVAGFVSDAIRSVKNQSERNWELILIDDCSSDNSLEVVSQFAREDERVKVIRHEENSGAAVARNTGIDASRGRYIAFLDADDQWEADKLERQLSLMRDNDWSFSYTDYVEIDEFSDNVIGRVHAPDVVDKETLLRSNPVCCSTAIYDSEALGKVLMPLIRKRQDWGLWLRLSDLGAVGHRVPEELTVYRVRSGSVSSNKLVAMAYVWRLYRSVLRFNVAYSAYRTIVYAFVNIRKYRKKRAAAKPA